MCSGRTPGAPLFENQNQKPLAIGRRSQAAPTLRDDYHACYLYPEREDAQNPPPRIVRTFAAANRRDWANPDRIRCPKIGGGIFGRLMYQPLGSWRISPRVGGGFVTPPRRNSENFAPPPRTNSQPQADLRGPRGAKFTEFRLTRKKKNVSRGKNRRPISNDEKLVRHRFRNHIA